jgi:hypothetical protein
MDRLKKPKDFLEKLRLTDSDYQDSGMINHISDLLERYNAEQLILHGVSNRRELLIAYHKHSTIVRSEKLDKFIENYVDDYLSNL